MLRTAATGLARHGLRAHAGVAAPRAASRLLATKIEVPSMGDSISEGSMMDWNHAVGDYVFADEVLVELETDKVTVEVKAPVGGVVTEQMVGDGDTVETGQVIAVLDETADAPEGAAPAEAAAPAPAEAAPAAPAPAAPAAALKKAAPAAAPAAPVVAGARTERRVAMSRMRKRIAERLKEAQNTAAMLTTFNEIDMGPLMALRGKYKVMFLEQHGVKLGFMSAFVLASKAALLREPSVNGYIDDGEIVYKDYVDISVAVASKTGLVVPVLRNVEMMGFADVERSIGEMAGRAREGTLAMEDFAGGNFTISNGGVFGSLFGTPIINPPQSAILGMHAINKKPVVNEAGEIVVKPMMVVALTYDHRIVDGKEAVTFLKHIKEKIEDPHRFVLDL